METLLSCLQEHSHHLTSQEYFDAMNSLAVLQKYIPPAPAVCSLLNEDPYFLLFLFVEMSTDLRRNPEYVQGAFSAQFSHILNQVSTAKSKRLKAAIAVCLFQYMFNNSNFFSTFPQFYPILERKITFFIEDEPD